jgi:dihydropteroate synthase
LIAQRAQRWQIRDRVLTLGKMPLLMGIVNVTPDSFSDGGRFRDPAAAIEHALRLAAQGADILDIGGESTRPGSQPVGAEEQLRRVLPVIEQLARQTPLPLSIDTSSATVAREAIRAGAQIVNDITALAGDPEMVTLARDTGCGVCAMHMQGTPQTMQLQPTYQNVVEEVIAYLDERRHSLTAAGIAPDRIAVDPGIGFGKTAEHNWALLQSAGRFHVLGCPVLIGPSRKRFLRSILGENATADLTPPTIGVAVALAQQGVQILRVHDILPVRQAILACRVTQGG